MEEVEQSRRREFGELTPAEKVKAILAAVREPVSRGEIIRFSGINYDELDDKRKREVDTVFQGEEVGKSGEEGQEIYWLKADAKQAVEATVKMESVHGRIADEFEVIIAEMKRRNP